MAFREVRVFEVREMLRLRLAGEGLRSVERLSQVDRKTVRLTSLPGHLRQGRRGLVVRRTQPDLGLERDAPLHSIASAQRAALAELRQRIATASVDAFTIIVCDD